METAGGFGSYLLGLNKKTYELTGGASQGISAGRYKEPGLGWMTAYLFLACFVGLFALIPLRKVLIFDVFIEEQIHHEFMYIEFRIFTLMYIHMQILIVDYKLTFPSGMATAVLINGFHTRGDESAK